MTQLLHGGSSLAMKSELDLFSLPATQVSCESSFFAEIYPKDTITDNGPYEFEIPRDPMFLDLSKNYLYMKLSITKQDGTAIAVPQAAADAQATPPHGVSTINLLGKTFIKPLKLFLSDKLIYDSGDMYSYKSYIETMLSHNLESKLTYLQGAMYYQDEAGKMEGTENTGFQERGEIIKGSRQFEVLAAIHCDMFNQEQLLLS
ncbi:MAG: hypothetical protein P8X78_03985, partial [Nitrosopumilaceae archaeon]